MIQHGSGRKALGSATMVAHIRCNGTVAPSILVEGSQLRRDLTQMLAENFCRPVEIQSLHLLEETAFLYLSVDYQFFTDSEIDGRDPEAVEALIQEVLEELLEMPIEIVRLHLIIDLYVDL